MIVPDLSIPNGHVQLYQLTVSDVLGNKQEDHILAYTPYIAAREAMQRHPTAESILMTCRLWREAGQEGIILSRRAN